MRFIRALFANLIFSLNVLLVFLVIFHDGLEVPVWLQSVGRMHPLLLHLPIGFLLLAVILVVFRGSFKKKAFHNFLNFVLYFSALTAALTAIMGLLLSREGGYDDAQLNLHLYTGVCLSLLAAWTLWLSLYSLKRKALFNVSLLFTTVILISAGHFGSVLTHGENFVLQPLAHEADNAITDSTALYDAVIHPILKAKCMSCHNDRKVKGNLSMSTVDKIMKGGKHGPVWIAGDPEKSEIIKRIHLPEESDDHMPPAGKTQLSNFEMKLLYQWILAGADLTTPWTRFNPKDSLRIAAEELIHHHETEATTHYSFPFASKETIQKLNTPFCSVAQVSADDPGLKADFFLSQAFNHKSLEALLSVKEQLVILNLGKMPVTDADGKIISQFKNLERLNVNQTNVTDEFLNSLKDLTHLASVSLVGTAVDKAAIEKLGDLSSLKEVFLWNTKLLPSDTLSLQKTYPNITWNYGYQTKEILKLTPPLLVNQSLLLGDNESIQLKHNLPGTQIRYTLDGTDPDSTTGIIYQGPVRITKYSNLKTKAFKAGWYSSPSVEFDFFRQGVKPSSAKLLTPPDKDYKGEGVKTLLDNKKGSSDNFRDIAWLGYREKPFSALFSFEPSNKVSAVTLSYCENFTSYLLPPAFVELWAGNDETHLKLIQRISPTQPGVDGPRGVKGIMFQITSAAFTHFKLVAQPVACVPVWVSKKPDKGWVFIDEVIFN